MWSTRPLDTDALHFLRWGATFSLASQAMVLLFVAFTSLFISSLGSLVTLLGGPAGLLTVSTSVAITSILAYLASLLAYYLALDVLRKLDKPSFQVPWAYAPLSVVGLALTGLILWTTPSALLVGGVVLLAGYAATLVGVYRAGVRFSSERIRMGAALTLLPLLVGPLQVYLGVREAQRRLPPLTFPGPLGGGTSDGRPGGGAPPPPIGAISVSCTSCGWDNALSALRCRGCGRALGVQNEL
ncbi:MAG: hypothetical protein KGJ23_03015 [Euryarchaeota archaeon]|nr:hypothetical protein [Euryarchaeota archaeon]MDE1835569.1 hypothetical protein [Euryarchaeota archaeon]MDE1878917.1 hypothetical protein [Euryarchaeota archaeon]MDE2043809.1 hypothetical protein [Thermoplasmata archaeon]